MVWWLIFWRKSVLRRYMMLFEWRVVDISAGVNEGHRRRRTAGWWIIDNKEQFSEESFSWKNSCTMGRRRGWAAGERSSVTEWPLNGRTIIAGNQLYCRSSSIKGNSTTDHRRGTARGRIVVAANNWMDVQRHWKTIHRRDHRRRGAPRTSAAKGPSRRKVWTKARLCNSLFWISSRYSLVLFRQEVGSHLGYSWIQIVQPGGTSSSDRWSMTSCKSQSLQGLRTGRGSRTSSSAEVKQQDLLRERQRIEKMFISKEQAAGFTTWTTKHREHLHLPMTSSRINHVNDRAEEKQQD